ncbi:hypothetical protein HRbin13_01166 [bacterium HR13]|nr:hypothetical protein HRbin13_01166 [bacterium HR13]
MFVCNIHTESFGKFVSKTQSYVLFSNGGKAYKVKVCHIKVAERCNKIRYFIGIHKVLCPTSDGRLAVVVASSQSEFFGRFILTAYAYHPLVLPLKLFVAFCVFPVYPAYVHTYLKVLHRLYTHTKGKLLRLSELKVLKPPITVGVKDSLVLHLNRTLVSKTCKYKVSHVVSNTYLRSYAVCLGLPTSCIPAVGSKRLTHVSSHIQRAVSQMQSTRQRNRIVYLVS